MKITRVRALEILDSRGNPTVQAEVWLDNGIRASAQAPSGASTGTHEAVELRDLDPHRHGGRGVLQAVRNVEQVLGPSIAGMDAVDQNSVDARLLAGAAVCGAGWGLGGICPGPGLLAAAAGGGVPYLAWSAAFLAAHALTSSVAAS